jgi:hypothetical protein
MSTSSPYPRSALKLIARVRKLGKRTVPALSNLAALVALTAFIVVAWAVIAFTRVGLTGAQAAPDAPVAAERTDVQAAPVAAQTAPRPTTLSKRESLVYVVDGDKSFYHCPGHVMEKAQRRAVSLPAAKDRGLAPCPLCFKVATR